MRLGDRPRVIAHRGFSAEAPENTLVAIERAIALEVDTGGVDTGEVDTVGVDMVEVDVGRTRDGHPVVLHDETLDRTTDGSGPLAEATLAEVRRLDAGSWFAPEFSGEPVPTLGEVLDTVRGRVLINLEIKAEAVTERLDGGDLGSGDPDGGDLDGGFVARVLGAIEERGMLDQVVISSFEPEALRQVRRLAPTAVTASLYDEERHRRLDPLAVMAAVGSQGFNLCHHQLDRQILERCHAAGRPVAVYTVNDEATMRRLIDWGVDAIFTDRPDRLLGLLARHS